MATRNGSAQWNGNLMDGSGTVTVGDGVWSGDYSFASRFEEGDGTNPEELIAAAHAGCFSMALTATLGRAGHDPQSVATTANVHLNRTDEGFRIQRIDLVTEADVPGLDDAAFQELAETAKKTCP